MFLLNSCLSLFSAARSRGLPFFRSYGDILPSSLAMLLPSAHHALALCGGFASRTAPALDPGIPSPVAVCLRVPTVLLLLSTGIYTCCPSATPFGLTLGPDFPRADQLYPGYLGYSAVWILTILSLLIPAFSLPRTPPLLSVWLPRSGNAPLPMLAHP